MKQVSRKLTLVLLSLLSLVLVMFGTLSLRTNASAEDNAPNATTVSSEWYEFTYTENSLEFRLNGNYRDYLHAHMSDVKELGKALLKAGRNIVVENILNSQTPAPVMYAARAAAAPSFDPDSFDWGDTGVLRQFKDYVTERLSDPQEFVNYVNGDYDMLIDYAIGQYVQNNGTEAATYEDIQNAIQNVVETAHGNVLNTVAEEERAYYEGLLAPAQERVQTRVENVQQNGGEASISLKQLLASLRSISVDGNLLFSKEGALSEDGLRYLLKLMPKPSAIANMTDAQLADLISANVTLDTTYGEVSCDLTFGFYGSTGAVKKAAQYIADHVAGSLNGNDVNLSVVTPQTFAKVFSKFVQSTRFSDENKNLVFSVFGKTVDEIYDKVTSYTFDQLIDMLRGHDFQYWFSNFMDAEFINSYFGNYIDIVLDRPLTNEDIDRVIDKLHNFFAPKMEKLDDVTVEQVKNWLSENIPGFNNITVPEKAERMAEKLLNLAKKVDWAKYDSAYIREILATSTTFNDTVEDYLDRLANYDEYYDLFMGFVEKVYNYVPERFKDGTIVDLYNGNSNFSYSGTFTVDIEKILNKAASVLRNRGFETMAGYAEDAITLFNQLTYTVDLSLELDFTNLYKVTYMVGENVVREGFLPVGVNGETITTLANLETVGDRAIEYWATADDLTTPVSEMPANDVTLVAVLEKIQIEKPTALEDTFTYTGEPQTYLPVGFDETTMTVENNEQTNAGTYNVIVKIADPENYEWTDGTADDLTFEWTIGKIALEQPTLDKTELTYGDEGVTLGGFDEATMTMSEADTAKLTATKAGEYSIEIAIKDTVNYEWKDGTTDALTLTWTIKKAVLEAPTAKEQEYIYNTEEQEFALEGFDKTTMTVEGNKQTNAGDYTVEVGLADADNYEWAEGAQTSFTWKIKKAQLAIPVAATSKVYTYDGTEQNFLFLNNEPDEATMTVANNKQTNAGTYNVTVSIKDTANYEWTDGKIDALTFAWTINKQSITITAELSATEFTYDGTEKAVTVALTGDYKDYATFTAEGTAATVAGEYTATATLALKEAYQQNYTIGNEGSKIELTWVINKAEIDAPTNVWNEQASFVYGEDVIVEYKGFADGTETLFSEVVYTVDETAFGDVTWNAGDYTVTATFALSDTANYCIKGTENTSFTFTKTVSVTAKEIDLTGAEWVLDPDKLTYNGEAQDVSVSINVDGATALSDAEKEAARNAAIEAYNSEEQLAGTAANGKLSLTDAGTYYIYAKSADDNYTFKNMATAEITVAQQVVQAIVEWSDVTTFTYDGTEKTVTMNSAIVMNLANGDYEVGNVTGNKATNAGSYKASLTITLNNANYKFDNNTATYTSELDWTIEKATVAVNVNWNYTAPLDFGAHELDVEVTLTPALVKDTDYTVEITGNSANTAGTHTAKVKVTLLNANYKFDGAETFEASKDWVIKEEVVLPGNYEANHEFELGTTEVKLTIKEGNVSTSLTATAGKEANFDLTSYEEKLNKLFADKELALGAAYDIHFENADGQEMNVSGKFEVRLMIPEKFRSLPDDQLAVIHIEDNGNVSNVDGARRDGNEMVFEADGFSVYAVISLSPVTEPQPEPVAAMPWWAIALLVVVAVLLLIALILLIMFVKNVKSEEPTEEVAQEEVEEPAPEEEAPVEEETPAEEPAEEEAPAEEPVEEEKREPIYIPVYPDAPVEKTPYVPVGGNEPETEIAPVVAPVEDENVTILDKSFTARLTQADSALQTMYSELKNYILSYKYVRSRVSWGYDSFNKGRSKICKLQIKGKSLIMYIALDPEALDAKYHHKNVSDVAKYADVPTKLKVRSARSLKYAKELIDMIMKNMEIEQGELESLNYVPVYKSIDELIAAGEIKKKEVAAPDFWNMDAADVVENSPELPEVELPDLDEEE